MADRAGIQATCDCDRIALGCQPKEALVMSADGVTGSRVLWAMNLGKRYALPTRPGLRLRQSLVGKPQADNTYWALRGVSLSVRAGSILGVIGRNGSGKSTLLSILAGVVAPTTGFARASGRVAAILDLGSGFHPELTGRENVLYAASLFGMSSGEISLNVPQIERFAEIGEFFDKPLRIYSAGMICRLAFALCAHLPADVLLLDEVLGVGDAAFQRKCFRWLSEARARGVGIVIATHDTNLVRVLCDEAILLEGGKLHAAGAPAGVVDAYQQLLLGCSPCSGADWESPASVADSGGKAAATRLGCDTTAGFVPGSAHEQLACGNIPKAAIVECLLLGSGGKPATTMRVGDLCTVEALVRVGEAIDDFAFGVLVRDRMGQAVFGESACVGALGLRGPLLAGTEIRLSCRFYAHLRQDTYFVSLGLGDPLSGTRFCYLADVLKFTLEPAGRLIYGLVDLPFAFSAERIESAISFSPPKAGDDCGGRSLGQACPFLP